MAHTRGSEIFLLSLSQSEGLGQEKALFDPTLLIDLKAGSDMEKTIKILAIQSNRVRSGYLIVGTTHGIYLISLPMGPIGRLEFNNNFVCPLTF